MNIRFIDAGEVARRLTYEAAVPLVRQAMIALAQGRTRQLLRGIIDLDGGNAFGVMPGAMDQGSFGAKLVSVFPGNVTRGGMSHQGLIVMFDPETGAPVAVVDAGEVTAIRTAAASAAATQALALGDANHLAVLGTGEQARRHILAIRAIRPLQRVTIWGRDAARAAALAEELGCETAPSPCEAVADAAIICTVTAAAEPILFAPDVRAGSHINAVGSSRAGPAEIATDLVVRSRFFADHRAGVLNQGAEFLRAKAEGAIDDDHVLGEIGEVFAGSLAGRIAAQDVTLYKSLGSIVQDLACAAWLCREDGG
ncbi:ornithine cyclodeaminase family protein [Sphingomonas sp. IC4-52]|uniref:ornithine cyclodeaminase family protein n=1 Tax=Sphingomonas sp. IC4-52 TaxID=2887202 RepID=UPI001D0FC5FE|nr:ornithine cyclodeaminase family protein [Sphingomonas sp. IC4-52]MCC2981401.1 ornithine cyclodeaminase family protein [Sphingomonas sp. IC4-52]